ncbi:hypothetical protein E4U55_001925 [Claviceps digitariae]|nr:hypothetical protein E4U55_001925 [Claviceps digitariae]
MAQTLSLGPVEALVYLDALCLDRVRLYDSSLPAYKKKPVSMIINSQPCFHPRPVGLSTSEHQVSDWRAQKSAKKSFGPKRTSVTGRSHYLSDGTLRRPLISAPSDFRHVQSGFCQPESNKSSRAQPVSRPIISNAQAFVTQKENARPLEPSIYLPDHQRISPILPHLEFARVATSTPPPAYCAERSEQVHHLSRQHSDSSQSFDIPRRQLHDSPPRVPAKSKHRARAYTSPKVDAIRERVASALMEVELLQKQIDNVIKRQSLYVTSRPSTSHSMAQTTPVGTASMAMPSIPALPPAAPSFSERLNADVNRQRTLTLKTNPASCQRLDHEDEGRSQPCTRQRCDVGPLSHPLPLVPRPPLRKKKSFSAVSSWLFSDQELTKTTEFEPVTNDLKPVKGKDGFYQIVSGPPGRCSFQSFDSISTWYTEDGDQTSPTTWSSASKSM